MAKKKYGYKAFDYNPETKELSCSPNGNKTVFKVGEVFEIFGKLELCKNGIHFCFNIIDCCEYYNVRNSIVICKVEILGDIINDISKSCTNKIKVLKPIIREEMFRLLNNGTNNLGHSNTGHWNTGHSNTGDWNTGDWNTGFFNKNCGKVYIFDKLIENMSWDDVYNSSWYAALNSSPFYLTKWIEYTDDEKQSDKAKHLTGGRSVSIDYKDACLEWWKGISVSNKKHIVSMPNFCAKQFEEITGINVDKVYE